MGFSSIDDLVSEMAAGKAWRQDFTKAYTATDVFGAGTVVAGRWYDLTGYAQNPYLHGNYIYNAHMVGGLAGWTPSSANISWDSTNLAASKTGASSETLTQNTDCVNGTTYEVIFTLAGYTGSGNVTVSLGGTSGTGRTTNNTFTENISCGATANAPLVITFASTVSAGRVDNIIVRRLAAFTPYSDAAKGRETGIWHGGNVSSETKHLTTFGAWTTSANWAGAILYLVDLLGCYPKISTQATSTSLNNTLTLPRYTDGKGVRAFMSLNTTNGTGTPNLGLSYTAPGPTAGRSLGANVQPTASAINGHIYHSGVAASNFGPFLPLAGGDAGIVSVETLTSSAASGSLGYYDLVLCKPLCALPITTAFIAAERDLLTQLPSLPRIYDGACLGLIAQAGAVVASTNQIQGYIETVWG